MDPIKHNADSRLGFTLHTITGFHRPSLTHYYGFICHLTLATFLDHSLNDTSNHLIGSNARLPQLLHWLPVRNSTLKHKTGLTEYRASRYFARLPSCLAESGSLALCTSNFLWLPSDPAVGQQRPCHSDYLPLSQGDSGFFQPDGFASFAGQTKKADYKPAFKSFFTNLKICTWKQDLFCFFVLCSRFFNKRLKFVLLEHFNNDVATTNKLTFYP